jgi:NAD(P)-dependent dehydrogenase (short-subunit alcohol dehydrogenase family)
MRFLERVTVITGGSLGIGRAAARAFGREGAHVVIVDVNAEQGEAGVQEIRSAGGEAIFIGADISVEDEVRAMVDRVVNHWDRLDVLVNNAGVYIQGDAEETSAIDWNHILAVNLTGPFLCTKYAAPVMMQSGGGVIINVASEAGLVGIKGQVAYNVSKGGLIALTRSCAVDFASHGIRVNSVCPGTTNTPLVEEAVNRAEDPVEARRRLEEVRPLNRLGTPEEIAAAIVFLATDEAAYATGLIFGMDGGYTAQ